ncbi:MAG: HAMP domain-containing histidine kinase, partial [Myxococcales bacterium]|nr:HAMP domain-containing histidine kinase [Myxococcales bacterium]
MYGSVREWAVEGLGLFVLWQLQDGEVRANPLARAKLGPPPSGEAPPSLRASIARIAEIPADSDALLELLAGAHAGEQLVGRLGSYRVAIGPGEEGAADGEGGIWIALSAETKSTDERTERRALAGDLAAGVSHEVGSALSAVLGWAQLALEHPEEAPAREALETIVACARVARETTSVLLDSARPSGAGSERTDLSGVLRDVKRLLRIESRDRQVAIELLPSPPIWIAARRGEAFIIAWNLARNAIQATPPGGTLRIGASATPSGSVLLVEDDGEGMDAATRARIFEPFHTTRPDGSGLGLALVRRTVEATGASLSLESAPGRGTTFEVRFEPASAPQRRPPRSGTITRPVFEARVLVVEDDPTLRSLIVTALGLRGADVAAAGSAAEAAA